MLSTTRLVLAITAAALLLPAAASAATVSVTERPGTESYATLTFEAAPAEANDLTVSVASESPDHYALKLLDNGAAVAPGAGCSGGGAPGVAVLCSLHKPSSWQIESCTKVSCTYVPGSFWETTMSFTLGNGGSRLDASSLPKLPSGGAEAPPIAITVQPGAGDDTVITGSSNDTIESSPGNDTIRTGAGNDRFLGGPAPDGADDVELGGDSGDLGDYSQRQSSVSYHENDLADDGAPGEGDRIVGAREFVGGAGDDVIEGASPTADSPFTRGDVLVGGPGSDLLIGGEGNDWLIGGEGGDRMYGRGGEDRIGELTWGPEATTGGSDFADGGPGDDEVQLGYGDDRAEGGPGEDKIELGPGNDSGEGGGDSDFLRGGEGDDQIAGGEGDDRLLGDRGRDTLEGGGGNDLIAAGAVVGEPWGSRFIYSPGPFENEPDLVDCGEGSGDKATVDKTDSAVGCEVAQRVRMLELFGVFQAYHQLEAQLQYVVRHPGLVTLTSSGLRPQRQKDHAKFGEFTHRLLLHPTGPAKRRLNRTGHVKIPLEVTLRWGGGHKAVVKKTIRLHHRLIPG